MRFTLIDRIVDLKSGDEITAIKNLSLAEEYLGDHFPLFPVLPGVFMLEAMTQAGAWLIRDKEDFANSIVLLKEARNIKYADFVQPGSTLTVTAKLQKHDSRLATFKTQGMVGDRVNVSAKLILERYNLADTNPKDAPLDDRARQEMRALYQRLLRPITDETGTVS